MALVITDPERCRLLIYLLPVYTNGGVGQPWGASGGLGCELTPACLKPILKSDHKALFPHSMVKGFSHGLQEKMKSGIMEVARLGKLDLFQSSIVHCLLKFSWSSHAC